MNDLHHGMDPCVGATRAMGANGCLGEFLQGFFKLVLHGLARALALPPFVGLSRVAQSQSNALTHKKRFEGLRRLAEGLRRLATFGQPSVGRVE